MTGAFLASGTIFNRISVQLSDCEAAGLRIEEAVADLLASRGGAVDTARLADLQELDVLVQRLRDLAAFAGALGQQPQIDSVSLGRAFETLKLERMRTALSGSPDPGHPPEPETLF